MSVDVINTYLRVRIRLLHNLFLGEELELKLFEPLCMHRLVQAKHTGVSGCERESGGGDTEDGLLCMGGIGERWRLCVFVWP